MSALSPPPAALVWERVEGELALRQEPGASGWETGAGRRALARRLVPALLAIGLVALGVGAWRDVEAIGARALRTLQRVAGTVVQRLTGYERPRPRGTDAPPDSPVEVRRPVRRTVSLDEARRRAPFPVRAPRWLPAGYELREVALLDRGGSDVDVIMRFAGPGGGATLIQVFVPDGLGAGASFDRDDALPRDVDLGTARGPLVAFKTGMSRLSWVELGVLHSREGRLPPDELVRMARSLR